jgi:hypothetical protein
MGDGERASHLVEAALNRRRAEQARAQERLLRVLGDHRGAERCLIDAALFEVRAKAFEDAAKLP